MTLHAGAVNSWKERSRASLHDGHYDECEVSREALDKRRRAYDVGIETSTRQRLQRWGQMLGSKVAHQIPRIWGVDTPSTMFSDYST